MWRNIKYYVLAFAIILTGTLVSTGLQLVESSLPVGHPASTLAANLSGVTLGGFIMVIGFLRDSRLEEERKRVEEERKRTKEERERAEAAEARVQGERERAEAMVQGERERADRYMEELVRLSEQYMAVTKDMVRRLQDMDARNGETRQPDE